MPQIEWSDDYKTGILDIDREHQSLFMLINALYDKVEKNSAESTITTTIKALMAYVDFHFAREEGLLTACNYPNLEEHTAGHRKLQSQLETYKEQYESSPETFDMTDFLGFLSFWIKAHILETDMAYTPHVQQHLSGITSL